MSELKKWKILSEENISPSKWFPLYKHTVQLSSGKIMDDYYIAALGDVAMIVPVTPEGKLIFVRQYKHGAREITLEFPAGVLEPNQTALEAAYAELEQETGITANNMTLLGKLNTLPSKNFSTLYGFVAKDVEITKEQDLDESEEIEIVSLSKEDVAEKILSGEINCSDTIALFALYQLQK